MSPPPAPYESQGEAQRSHDKRRDIEKLLSSGAFTTVFQPIVELDSKRIVGAEALTRVAGEEDGAIETWFKEAAKVGLAQDLELATLRAALAQLPALPEDVFLTVNVSPATAILPEVHRLLTDQADRMVVELTEHAVVLDYPLLHGALEWLREHGVRLAIDDAGGGYASLRRVVNLRPNIIKLDLDSLAGSTAT